MFLRHKINEKSWENQQAGEAQDGGQQTPKSILTLLKGNRGVIIRSLVILQTYLFLACSLAIFAIAHTFGKAQQVNRLVFLAMVHLSPRSYRSFWRRIPFGRLSAIFASFVAITKRQFPPIQRRMESPREARGNGNADLKSSFASLRGHNWQRFLCVIGEGHRHL